MATPNQQAQKIVQDILGPQIRSTTEQYRNQGAGLQAAYNALATMNAGVAPSISATYDAASARQAVIAKGYADGFKQASEKAAFDANALLAQNNSPQTVNSAGEAGANALYGFGGAIPAGTLNQQGAAFTAAAKFLPGQDRNLGIDAVKSANIGSRSAVADLEAKRPSLVQDALGQINDAQAKKDQMAFEAKVFGIKQGNETFDQQLALIKENRLQSQSDLSNSIRLAGLGLSRQRLKLAYLKEARLGKTKKKGGFTSLQLRNLAQTAYETAADDFHGYTKKDGTVIQPTSPVETLRDLLAAGVPFSVAAKAIQRFALGQEPDNMKGLTAKDKKGNEMPLWAFWQATAGWTK